MNAVGLRKLYIISFAYAFLVQIFLALLLLYIYSDNHTVSTAIVGCIFALSFIAFFIVMLGLRRWLVREAGFAVLNSILVIYLCTILMEYVSVGAGFVAYKYWLGGFAKPLVMLVVVGLAVICLGILQSVLEILIGTKLKNCQHELFGLRGVIATSYLVAGIANLVSLVISPAFIVSVFIYMFLPIAYTLLFRAACRVKAGLDAQDYRYGAKAACLGYAIAVSAVCLPSGVAIYELLQQPYFQEECEYSTETDGECDYSDELPNDDERDRYETAEDETAQEFSGEE